MCSNFFFSDFCYTWHNLDWFVYVLETIWFLSRHGNCGASRSHIIPWKWQIISIQQEANICTFLTLERSRPCNHNHCFYVSSVYSFFQYGSSLQCGEKIWCPNVVTRSKMFEIQILIVIFHSKIYSIWFVRIKVHASWVSEMGKCYYWNLLWNLPNARKNF